MRFASLADRDRFDPKSWRCAALAADGSGWYSLDLSTLGLDDGDYEYEFVLDGDGDAPLIDPWAEELVRYGGYRGIFHIRDRHRHRPVFCWDDELPTGVRLPDNDRIVIYEIPIRWTERPETEGREIGLGNFDHLHFKYLKGIVDLGVNAIELLPVQDASDTFNWGYATRAFFCPDVDLGTPVDMKLFIRACHRLGIRVILDVVMNHAKKCPLEALARSWYFCEPGEEEGRDETWGGRLFRLREQRPAGRHLAREFLYEMAEYWVREYHIDGYRIDEFKGIDNWEFVQEFRRRATQAHADEFGDRPFIVIAEDSWRRSQATRRDPHNPGGEPVVDAIWNFAFRDEARRLLTNQIHTRWGRPSRSTRIAALVSGRRMWDEMDGSFHPGFDELRQAINYICSHDVEKPGEERFMNYVLESLLTERTLGDGSTRQIQDLVDGNGHQCSEVRQAHADALDRAGSAFALLMTAVGIPMFLAGEEFGEVHDLEHGDWRLKMVDPLNPGRAELPGHRALRARVGALIRLRVTHPALRAGDVEFEFVPGVDDDHGPRTFAYYRTGGRARGCEGQVVVVVNAGPGAESLEVACPWLGLTEHGAPLEARAPRLGDGRAAFDLAPFQVRVFTT